MANPVISEGLADAMISTAGLAGAAYALVSVYFDAWRTACRAESEDRRIEYDAERQRALRAVEIFTFERYMASVGVYTEADKAATEARAAYFAFIHA